MSNLLFTSNPANVGALRLAFQPDTQPDATSVKALGELAAYQFEAGLYDYEVWAERMAKELGDPVKPHLRKVWISIPQGVSSRADELTSSPLTTQTQRVAVGLRCKDLIAIWQASHRN